MQMSLKETLRYWGMMMKGQKRLTEFALNAPQHPPSKEEE